MDQIGLTPNAALAMSLLLLLSMLLIRQRQGQRQAPRKRPEDRLDTLQSWPAQLVRVMTPLQRQAHDVLRHALPGNLILVQTPLAQFMRVSTRNSYTEWYRRAGRLRASFLVCDQESIVIAAVDLRPSNESEREQARHARLIRVLESVGLPVLVWTEEGLPSAAQVRARFASLVRERVQSPALAEQGALDASGQMSAGVASMAIESTDFAGLDTAPTPFDESSHGADSGRGERLATS